MRQEGGGGGGQKGWFGIFRQIAFAARKSGDTEKNQRADFVLGSGERGKNTCRKGLEEDGFDAPYYERIRRKLSKRSRIRVHRGPQKKRGAAAKSGGQRENRGRP